MEGLGELVHEVGLIRKDLEELRYKVLRGDFVPIFTKRMLWALLLINGLTLLLSSLLLYEIFRKNHEIYSLLLEYAETSSPALER